MMRRAVCATLAVLTCLTVAAVALAGSPRQHVADSQDAVSPANPKVRALMDAAARAHDEAESARTQPDARRHRQDSRDAYRGLSPGDARALGRRKFASTFDAPALDVSRFGHIVQTNRFSALIQADDGRQSVVDSSTPLTSDVGDGKTAPVSLALDDHGDHWAPHNPAIATSLPKDLAHGLELPSLGFRIVPADGHSGDPSTTADKAFYPDIATDTDLLVTPTPQGIETYFQVRSANSPDEIPLHFHLAAGDRLEPTKQPGIAARVMRGAAVVADISAPQTLDAGETPVPTSATVRGDEVVVSFPHRDRDVEYPLMVDPLIGGNVVESYGWSPDFTCPTDDQPCTNDLGMPWFLNNTHFFSATSGSQGPGLYIGNLSGASFTAHDDAYWGLWSPGSAYIYRTEYAYARLTEPAGGPPMCVGESYWDNPVNNFAYGHAYVTPAGDSAGDLPSRMQEIHNGANPGSVGSPYFDCDPTGVQRWIVHCYGNNPCSPVNTDGTQPTHPEGNVFWQMYAGANGTASHTGTAYLGAMFLFEHDLDRPYFTSVSDPNRPTGWVDSVSPTATATAQDTGLGVKQIRMRTSPPSGSATIDSRVHPCTGDHTYRCPALWGDGWYPVPGQDGPSDADIGPTWTQGFTYNTAAMAEGINTLGLLTIDAIGNPSTGTATSPTYSQSWQVKVDHSPPQLLPPSGTLWDHRSQTSDHRNEGLYDAAYTLKASAADGSSFGTPPQNRSGVVSIDFQVDGNTKFHFVPTCAGRDNCSGTTPTWTFNSDDYTDGDHTVSVVAKDRLAGQSGVDPNRHTTTTSFHVVVDRQGDIYNAKEYDGDPSSGGEFLSSEWTRVTTTEARSEDGDTIATRHPVDCPQGSSSSSCDEVDYRILDPDTGEPTDTDEYHREVGDRNDSRLEAVSDIAQRSPAGSQTQTGPINDALAPWQHAPPAHGANYQLYKDQSQTKDDTGNDVTVVTQVWVDSTNLFPLKKTTAFADGTGLTTTYYDYAVGRLTDAQVSTDLFAVPRPSNPSSDEYEELDGTGGGGQANDTETNQTFTPMWIGQTALVGTDTYCLATNEQFRSTENDPAYVPAAGDDPDVTPDPSGPITAIDADYNVTQDVSSCQPGAGSLANPDLTISAYGAGSTVGQAWAAAYNGAIQEYQAHPDMEDASEAGTLPVVLDGMPATAYIVPYAPDQLAVLVSSMTTAYTVKGRMTRTEVPVIIAAMQPIP